MDETVAQVLLGVFTNALSSVLEKGWSNSVAADLMTTEAAVEATTQEFLDVERIAADVGGERLRAFLAGPEVSGYVRLLFVSRVHASDGSTEELREAFSRAFARQLPKADARHAERVFAALATGSERILAAAAKAGDPAAGEALDAARFRHLAEELSGLKESLDALHRTPDSEIGEFLEWEQIYRRQVLVRHGTITPPSFDAVERVPVDEIYVETTFVKRTGPNTPDVVLTGDQLARQIDRTVILGDPGAGKSTFALKLTYDLARGRARVPGGSLTPVLITLKDYGAEKQQSRASLVEWVESVVNTDYSAPAPNGAIPYLLTAGRLVVLFDGLDELLDTSYRQEITADIETFAARFVAAPILVTSRRVGYEQAPLDPRRFEIARLNELDENQVEQYSRLWFGLRRELKEKERERMASDFVRDSAEAADDLRRNTLMLALLCNIYRGDGYIPRRRPQVYEKCAVMLFERWDRGRRIVAPLEFERHLRPAMQHLAYWIYADPSLRGGVTEAALVRSATQFLTERRFEDEDDARQEARKFVEYCRGRAWVFTDTGTTPDGERLYQFTHRTFLEFFAAEHLVRTNRTPADLASLLRPHVHAGEWDVVAQLAFQLQDDNIDGAADDLLIDLLTHAAGEHRDVTLSFAARALSFLVPRRQTCREVAKAVTRRTCEWLASDTADARSPSSMPAETHVALVNADRENLHPVSQALVDEAVSFLVENPNVAAADAALEVACNTDMAMAGRTSNEPRESWDPARITAFEAMWPTLTNYTAASERVAYDAFFFGAIDLDAVARLHSAEALFESRSFRIYGNYIRSAIVDLFLSGQLGQRTRPGGLAIGTREELGSLGRTLLALQPPWSVQEGIHSGLYHQFAGTVQPRDDILEGSELFGAFATLAFTTERAQNAGDINDTLAGLERGGGWLALLNPWIRRRYVDDEVSPSEVPTLPVDGATADAISRWSEGQWSAMSQSPATELRDLP